MSRCGHTVISPKILFHFSVKDILAKDVFVFLVDFLTFCKVQLTGDVIRPDAGAVALKNFDESKRALAKAAVRLFVFSPSTSRRPYLFHQVALPDLLRLHHSALCCSQPATLRHFLRAPTLARQRLLTWPRPVPAVLARLPACLPAFISYLRAAPSKPQRTHTGSGASGCADVMSGQTASSSGACCSEESMTDSTLLRCERNSSEECEQQINQRMILRENV